MNTEFIHMSIYGVRSQFVAKRFQQYFGNSLLDVGCHDAPLREIVENTKYTGIDVSGNPDIQLNLEQCEALPFTDGQFSSVICIDVLEHLDNLHAMFDELVRVSDDYIIVSLPNCWRDARRALSRGIGEIGEYGLPMERPLSRHKWFFSFSAAQKFLTQKAQQNNLSVVDMFATEKPKSAFVRALRHLFYPGDKYRNRYSQTIWVVLKKEASA